MASLNMIAERIAIAVGKEKDIAYMEALKFSVQYYRAVFIRRDMDKNEVSDEYMQRMTLPVEKSNPYEDIGITPGICIVRTVEKIPTPVRLKSGEDFKFVGSIYNQEVFEKRHLTQIPATNLSRNPLANTIYYDYINGYIELYNACTLEYVTIEAAFEDPLAITGEGCLTGDSDYPCPADMLQGIIDGLISNELQLRTDNQTINVDE